MATVAAWIDEMAPELDVGLLYQEHGKFIARVIERLTGAGPHVDDLLQDCFIAAFKSRNRYDPAKAAATTWLYAIAANISRRHLRGRFRFDRFTRRLAREEITAQPAAPDEAVARAEEAAVIREVLGKLPFKQREVFCLYELEGLDGPTIAQMAEIPEGTVWTRLHHARKRFTLLMRKRMVEEVVS